MHDWSDAQLLRDYVNGSRDEAFTALVARHTNAVYSAALRQTASPDLARDVAQSVFTDLARKASSLASITSPEASLLAWLYKSVRYAALNALRDNRRRSHRERESMLQLDSNYENDLKWEDVSPVVDEAMAELPDSDREALLLRFFENRDYRSIGVAMGLSDDAAQKRVSRALDKLRERLRTRNIIGTTASLGCILSANAVSAAPAGLAASFSTTALTAALPAAVGVATDIAIMTTLQKSLIAVLFVATVGTTVYQQSQNGLLRDQVATISAQHGKLLSENERLSEDLRRALTNRSDQNQTPRDPAITSELLRLRDEVTRLKNERLANPVAAANGDGKFAAAATEWLTRVSMLKERLQSTPSAAIPELELLSEEDWLGAVKDKNLSTEIDYRKAMSSLRHTAEDKMVGSMQVALKKYSEATGEKFPTHLGQLKEYFTNWVSDDMLARYVILDNKELPNLGMGGEKIITQKAPVDPELDGRSGVGLAGYGRVGPESWKQNTAYQDIKTLERAMKAFKAKNNGYEPTNPEELVPFLTDPNERSAVERLSKARAAAEQN